MKAVVVDIEGKSAVVLSKKGQFIKIRNNSRLMVGAEVEIPSMKGFGVYSLARTASIAAAFLFVIGLGFGVYSYNSPYSYISVDINPSIEITANRYNRIINIEALNDDGAKIIAGGSFRNKSIEKGVESIIEKVKDEGYLKEDSEDAVMLTVSSKDIKKAVEVEKSIQAAAEQELKAENKETKVLVENVSIEKREDARKNDISPGKLVLIEKLQKESSDIKIDDYKNAPVRDIVKKIKESKKTESIEIKAENKENQKNEKNIKDSKDLKDTGNIQNQSASIKNDKKKPEENIQKPDDTCKNQQDNKSNKDNKDSKDNVNNGKSQGKSGDFEKKNEDSESADEAQSQIEHNQSTDNKDDKKEEAKPSGNGDKQDKGKKASEADASDDKAQAGDSKKEENGKKDTGQSKNKASDSGSPNSKGNSGKNKK